MLDHEQADEESCRGHNQQQADPIAMAKSRPHQSPDDKEGHCRDRQLEYAAHAVRLAIAGELFAGEYVNRVGRHFRVDSARLWDVPDGGVPIAIARRKQRSRRPWPPARVTALATKPAVRPYSAE